MALPFSGASAAICILNRALANASPANHVYLNQVSNAGTTASSEYAFAGQLGAPYAVGKTAAQLAAMVLANVGISATTIPADSYATLLAAGTDYIAFHGTHNIGIIALQFGQIISNLENDVTFGAAAKAWNQEVLNAYNYSSNTTSDSTQTSDDMGGYAGIVLDVGQDNVTGSGADDRFEGDVAQNALGHQINTLGSGDILDGGAGFDTIAARITNGVFAGGSESQPIQPETHSIEYIQLQAVLANVGKSSIWSQVFVNAKDMVGVKTISSNYSDASLTIQNLTTKGLIQLSDLTVNMSYTGNSGPIWDQSDFKVLFDQDYLTPVQVLGSASIDFLAMNEDNYDASNGANPLTGVFFRTLNFTLNGKEFNLAAYLGEDPAGAGNEINTYADFLAAVQKGLIALKADFADNAALQSVTASFGRQFTTDINPVTLELRSGTSIRLTADGQTHGTANTLYVDSTDLEVARAGLATVPNNNRYEIADATPPLDGSKLAINVELEKVGLAGDGGALVIGSMNKGDDLNQWNGANTTVGKTTNGINEFHVTVKGNADKSSSLSQLRSTNNQLKVVTVKTDAAQTGTFANLTIGNRLTAGVDEKTFSFKHSLKDVKIFDALAFKGDLSLRAMLTAEVTAKYLNLKDISPAQAAADNAAFVYTGGSGNDSIDLQVSSTNLDRPGNATREDFSVNIIGGAGNDKITLSILQEFNQILDPGRLYNWYANQALNANLRIHGGDGNDIIHTPGSGNFIIDAGAGDDTVYIENTGTKAEWALNAATISSSAIQSSENNAYKLFKGQVAVSYKGFDATAVIADVRGVVTDLSINQAIKLAINNDAILSKLLSTEDGPANTLVITSLIDGVWATAEDLGISLVAPATLTVDEIAQLNTWYGVSETSVASNEAAVTAFNDDASTTYLTHLLGRGGQSGHVSDNTITGGPGNDLLVLGSSDWSNSTLVYTDFGNGTDSIVNFTVIESIIGEPIADTVSVTEIWSGDESTPAVFEAKFISSPAFRYAFDGVKFNVTPDATAAEIASSFVAHSDLIPHWIVTIGATPDVVIFTAEANGPVPPLKAGDFKASAFTTMLQSVGFLDFLDFLDFSSYSAVGMYVGADLVKGAAVTALGQKYITLTESSTNPGVYTVQEWTEIGALGSTGDVAQLIGVLDFGSTQAFTAETFII